MSLIDSHAHLDMYSAEDLPRSSPAPTPPASAPSSPSASAMAPTRCTAPSKSPRPPTRRTSHKSTPAPASIPRKPPAPPPSPRQTRCPGRRPRCIAIGEIGLDYYHVENPDIPIQQAAFVAQIRIAAAARKPILIHCRTSELATPPPKKIRRRARRLGDLLTLLAEHWTHRHSAGIMHCFSGTVDQARRSLDAGFYFSFAGNLTYPAAKPSAKPPPSPPPTASWSKPTPLSSPPSPTAASATSPPSSPTPPQPSPTSAASHPEELAALTTANFHRLFPITA